MAMLNMLNLLLISTVSNSYYLALFICHLFSSGPFRTIHILYDPAEFDQNILMEIESNCEDVAPLYLTDITRSFQISYQKSDNVDNLLQLFFFDAENLAHEIELVGDKFGLYRIFLFSSLDVIRRINRTLLFGTRNRAYDIRTLIGHYNESRVSVYIEENFNESSDRSGDLEENTILMVNHEMNLEHLNLFDRTFGEYERMETIELYRLDYYTARDAFKPNWFLLDPLINFYHFQLNRSFIGIIWQDLKNPSTPPIHHRTLIANRPKYYKESSHDYKLVDNGTL